MILIGYTATALSRNDIADTPTDKNVDSGAIVELKTTAGALVTIYDDVAGANPETQKTCDTNGKCTFFAEAGEYILEINGDPSYITISAIAEKVGTTAGINTQQFIDNFELKIFQSPTDNLTKIETFAGGVGAAYEVRKTSDNSLATIYSDKDGVTEILQNGIVNVSDGDAEVVFYIADGDYTVTINAVSSEFGVGHNSLSGRDQAGAHTASAISTSYPANAGELIDNIVDLHIENKTRQVPSASFSYLDILPTVYGVGNVVESESPVSYAKRVYPGLIGGGEVYVDPVNGDDASVSGSITAPVKTISEAVRVRPQSNVMLLGSSNKSSPAEFEKFDFRDTDTPGNKLKIVTAKGHCIVKEPGDVLADLTWTPLVAPQEKTYKAAITLTAIPPRVVLFSRYTDTNGDPLRLPNYTSIADAHNSGFGWHFDGTDLYIRIGSENIETIKSELSVYYGSASSRCLFQGTKMAIKTEGDSSIVFAGVHLLPISSGAVRAEFFADGDLEVKYSSTHGMDSLGSNSFIKGFKAFANAGDNFHYADNNGLGCQALEINCESTQAGDFVTRGAQAEGTNNGSSMHGNGHIARYGGKYYNNYGPDVVDTGTGDYWNVGVKAYGGQLASNAYGFDIVGGEMWLDTCHAQDEALADIRVEANSKINLFNTSYRTLTTAGGTSIVETYDPFSITQP